MYRFVDRTADRAADRAADRTRELFDQRLRQNVILRT
jgi:hypothetical protein